MENGAFGCIGFKGSAYVITKHRELKKLITPEFLNEPVTDNKKHWLLEYYCALKHGHDTYITCSHLDHDPMKVNPKNIVFKANQHQPSSENTLLLPVQLYHGANSTSL